MGEKLFDYVIGNPPYQDETAGIRKLSLRRFMTNSWTPHIQWLIRRYETWLRSYLITLSGTLEDY